MGIGTVLERPVGSKTPGEKGYVAPTENIRLPRDIVDMARIVVAHRKQGGNRVKLTDYIAAMVREQVTRDHAEIMNPPARKKKGEA